MSTILTKTAYAVARGVDPSAVSQWIKRGKLQPPAVTADGKIDVEEADRQLQDTLDLSRSISHGGPVSLLEAVPAIAPPLPIGSSASPLNAGNAQSRKAQAAAEIAELDRDERRRKAMLQQGQYLLADQVRAERGRALQQLVATLDNWVLFELPPELGLDSASVATLRKAWRRFRQRQAEVLVTEAEALPELLPEPSPTPNPMMGAHAA